MSVIRQFNVVGQMRWDGPHWKSIESSICGDFDVLGGQVLGGESPLVVKGFTLTTTGVLLATDLILNTAGSIAIHYRASESGSVFNVPADRATEQLNSTNPRVQGSFVPSQVNYVGVDFIRETDDSTSDLTMFMDATTEQEIPKVVPLARTIDYRIIVSTVDFSATPGICPVAKVTTNAGNEVVTVEDARNLFFRLGTGSSNPNRFNAFSWSGGRKENVSSGDLFAGGDKIIDSLKSAFDALATRVWEVGGGEYWYSPTADRNLRQIQTGTPFVSNGEFFEWDGTHAHWKGLRVLFDNSTGDVNAVADQTANSAGLTDLVDGDCLYVDLDRTQDRTGGSALVALKAPLITLGPGSPPGSRLVLAWRFGADLYVRNQSFKVGSSFKLATTAASGTVKVTANDADPIVPLLEPISEAIVAGGLSRLGSTASGSIMTAGDLRIGLGNVEGDENIHLFTDGGAFQTLIQGAGAWTASAKAAATIESQASAADGKNRVINEIGRSTIGGVVRNVRFTETDGAQGLAPVTQHPKTPAPTSSDPARYKTFARPNRWWRADCEVTDFGGSLPAHTAAGAGVGKTLTGNANGALTVDSVLLVLNDRVLHMVSGVADHADNGIYTLTQQGTGGQPFILTRAIDADSADEFVENMSCRVTAGSWGGTQWMASTIGPYVVDTTAVAFVALPNILTRDQECRMWHDGQITVVAESTTSYTPTIP